jgi:chorismate mutase / prephenate dehydratase
MSACLALEQTLRISYLGPAGTFSHDAVARHFGQFVEAIPCATIDEVFRAAESEQTDHAVVPVENSSEGAIGRTLDLMCQTPLTICGEIRLRIRQNVLSTATAIGEIRKVYSHAQSLAQCAQWLAQHLPGVSRVAVSSNAEAARLAAAEPGSAAIAGENAAAIYGLNVIAPHIEDEPNNTTRFWVLGRHAVPPSGRDETSLVMSAPNRPGAVYSLLEPFAKHGVSMSRFESRPARTGLWEYFFFVDLIGHENDAAVGAALAELRQKAQMLKLLGSYPSAIY